MKYLNIDNNMGDLNVVIPVVFKIGNQRFTGLLKGLVEADSTRPLEENESVEER